MGEGMWGDTQKKKKENKELNTFGSDSNQM